MFFYTQQDPNFRIKGSRDPLGFQPLWQHLGRNVIKYLSTVSVNIKDFQVLSYAWYFYGERDSKYFLDFFYKFEQACGFARGIYLEGDSFNGIDFVRKNKEAEHFTFSTQNQHTLLSNQKSYGIYGKYNRPFTEMRIKEQEDFRAIMERSLKEKLKSDFSSLQQKVNRLLEEEKVTMAKSEIEIFSTILKTLAAPEQKFYTQHILQTESSHVQHELFKLFIQQPELISGNFNLYGFIDMLLTKSISEKLKQYLIEIKYTEKVLVPYSFLFKKIQSTSIWTKDELTNVSVFDFFPKSIPYDFSNPLIADLSKTLYDEKFTIAKKAIERNKAVSDKRGNAAWMKEEQDRIVVSYPDGARDIQKYNPDVDYENNYFLPSYISMFRQIMPQV